MKAPSGGRWAQSETEGGAILSAFVTARQDPHHPLPSFRVSGMDDFGLLHRRPEDSIWSYDEVDQHWAARYWTVGGET